MKYLYRISVIVFIFIALSCNKSDNQNSLESINLNYDSLLVDLEVSLTPELKVAKLIDWEIDKKASQEKENMLYFNNINHHGMITVKAYDDENFPAHLQETLKTFEGLSLVSESHFTYTEKTYHQYILKSEGFIVLKALIEIDATKYIDTNLLIVESKYPEISQMIETYLASIARLN